jgi:hypothetical protein
MEIRGGKRGVCGWGWGGGGGGGGGGGTEDIWTLWRVRNDKIISVKPIRLVCFIFSDFGVAGCVLYSTLFGNWFVGACFCFPWCFAPGVF